MCFIIHEDHKEPKIADEDITCYKRFHHFLKEDGDFASINEGNLTGFLSFIYCAIYNFEEKYGPIELGISIDKKEIDKGFHSYNYEGFERYYDSYKYFIKCFIPEGSKYYYNPQHGEYVSDSIVIGGLKDVKI